MMSSYTDNCLQNQASSLCIQQIKAIKHTVDPTLRSLLLCLTIMDDPFLSQITILLDSPAFRHLRFVTMVTLLLQELILFVGKN